MDATSEQQLHEYVLDQDIPEHAISELPAIAQKPTPPSRLARPSVYNVIGSIGRIVEGVCITTAPNGIPLWVSDVLPGSTHDLTAAREQVLATLWLYTKTTPVLADGGYDGAGCGVLTPVPKRSDGRSNSSLELRRAKFSRRSAILCASSRDELIDIPMPGHRQMPVSRARLIRRVRIHDTA